MVAELVTARGHFAGDVRTTADIFAAHEKRGRHMILVQGFEQFRRRLAGAVVERERQRRFTAVAMIVRLAEHTGGTSPHGVGQKSGACNSAGGYAKQSSVHPNMIVVRE